MFKIPFQFRVGLWMEACFGSVIASNKRERNARFLEESLELVQSLGMSKEDALKLVDYTFSRPLGEPMQEVGGVTVTLAALCNASRMDLVDCSELELSRITGKEMMEKIRAKQASKKNIFSPLPEE